MLDTKQKITFPEGKYTEIEVGKYKVLVKNYLSLNEQAILMGVYLNEYFNEINVHTNVLRAEYGLLSTMLELITNIMTTEGEGDNEVSALDINDLLANFSVLKKIRESIQNYGEFRSLLKATLDSEVQKRTLDESLGKSLKTLFTQAQELIQNLSEVSVDPEKMENVRTMLKEVNESPILSKLGDLLAERKG